MIDGGTGGGATMRFELIEGILLVVHGGTAAADAEWKSYTELAATGDYAGMLVVIDAGFPGPSSHQRAEIAAANKRRPSYPLVAVVTHSALHRGIVTVLNWLQRGNLVAFHPSRLVDAMTYAHLADAARPAVLARIQQLGTQLGAASFATLHI